MSPIILAATDLDFPELLRNSASPLVLVSGIGLVILVVNARFMHVTDRLRSTLKKTASKDVTGELKALFKRAQLLRASLACLSGSIVSTILLVLCVIFDQLNENPGHAGVVLLITSTSLIGLAALLFTTDVFHSLRAIKLEMKRRSDQY
ncbi:DUF2721 domain-containing protein [Verrucomicrobiales bacterium]|nr:DUF2721 domain-containing protein [Verrucomicrobiales bacterium]